MTMNSAEAPSRSAGWAALVAIRDACERIALPNGCNDDFSLGWRKAHEKLGAFASSAIEAAEAQAAAGSGHYSDLLAFARRMAWMTTPQDEFEDDPQGFEDAEGLVADMSDDRLFGEYHTFMEMVREARALLKFPKEV